MCHIVTFIAMKITGVLARINPNGRIVIPAMIRKGMGVKLGEAVVMSLDDGILRIQAHRPRSRAVHDNRKNAEPEMPASSKATPGQPEGSTGEADEWLG